MTMYRRAHLERRDVDDSCDVVALEAPAARASRANRARAQRRAGTPRGGGTPSRRAARLKVRRGDDDPPHPAHADHPIDRYFEARTSPRLHRRAGKCRIGVHGSNRADHVTSASTSGPAPLHASGDGGSISLLFSRSLRVRNARRADAPRRGVRDRVHGEGDALYRARVRARLQLDARSHRRAGRRTSSCVARAVSASRFDLGDLRHRHRPAPTADPGAHPRRTTGDPRPRGRRATASSSSPRRQGEDRLLVPSGTYSVAALKVMAL